MSKVLLVYEDFTEMMNIESVLKKVGINVFSISSEFTLMQQILSFNPDIVIGYGKGPKVATLGVGRRLKEMPRWTGRVVLIFAAGSKPDPGDLDKIRMDMALEAPVDVTRLLQILAQLTNQDPQMLIDRMMRAVERETQAGGAGQRASSAGGEKDDSAVIVSGGTSADESWNVRGNKDLEDFNKLMGVEGDSGGAAPAAPLPEVAPQAAIVDAGETPPADAAAASAEGEPVPLRPQSIAEIELRLAQEHVHEKVEGYSKYLQGLELRSESTMKKKETRKVQKQLASEWKESELKSQDELRRTFTQALYKKKD